MLDVFAANHVAMVATWSTVPREEFGFCVRKARLLRVTQLLPLSSSSAGAPFCLSCFVHSRSRERFRNGVTALDYGSRCELIVQGCSGYRFWLSVESITSENSGNKSRRRSTMDHGPEVQRRKKEQ
jgi:hypothetical protein